MNQRPIIIIGTGIGGLSAAIRLAAAGEHVVMLEKNASVGGKMSQFRQDGFRWDGGPSVITMRPVFEELFASAGRNLSDYLTLLPVDPLTRYFFTDGNQLDASADAAIMQQRIAHCYPQEVTSYQRYLDYAKDLYRITSPTFIYNHPPTLKSFGKVPMRDWLKVDGLQTMQQKNAGFFATPQMQQLFGRFATYVGGSPYQAPATLNVIAHVEMADGVFYPQGGIYKMAEAFAQLARELGVEIQTSCPVRHIHVDGNRAVGVTLADGTLLPAKAVLSNVDVTTTYQRLLPNSRLKTKLLRRRQRIQPSGSGFALMLGVEGEFAQLAHHNVLFSADYAHEFDQIFQQGVPPSDPTIYIAITSKTDGDHAPAGCENWFILVNAPALDARFNWQQNTQKYRDLILNKLAARGLDIRDKIRSEIRLTPHDLQQGSGAYRGALYGASANTPLTAFLRPHNRSRHIKGLYFAGGTTHPGGGVPMVTLSGKVSAECILADVA